MDKVKRFFAAYGFIVIPIIFVIATILMDVTMFLFMGLRFPSRYYFSVLVMASICGLLFFIKKPAIQYAVCLILLSVHFAVGVANIIVFGQTREIISVESLNSMRQVATLTDFIVFDFRYMAAFSIIVLAFVGVGIWMFTLVGKNRKLLENKNPGIRVTKYRRNLSLAITTLAITAYLTSMCHLTLPNVSFDASQAYVNYTNDRFAYSTFTNRVKVLQEFGTYSYYWSNLSFVLGMKQEFVYSVPDEVVDTFTFPELSAEKRNVIVLQMETLEESLVNPYVMPNLYNFLYNDGVTQKDLFDELGLVAYERDLDGDETKTTAENTVKFEGLYGVDRTTIAEYSALAGMHLDGVEMNMMPSMRTPFALPNIMSNNGYSSVKAFHNFLDYVYNRNTFFLNGLGFDEFVALKSSTPNPNDMFNNKEVYKDTEVYQNKYYMNSDYLMFESQYEKMAPVFENEGGENENFFTWVTNISTHAPYYDSDLFNFYEDSGKALFGDGLKDGILGEHFNTLKLLYEKLNSKDERTRNAVMSYLTGAYEYDRGLGVLFDHLEDSGLLDTTTIVFYGDHHNYINPDLLEPTAAVSTGKTSGNNPIACGAQGRMIAFYIYSPAFDKKTNDIEEVRILDGVDGEPLYTYETKYRNQKFGNPNNTTPDSIGVVRKFFNHYDIYATICDLLHIKINTKYTLGISAFDMHENVGFSVKNSLIFSDKWAAYSLDDFAGGFYTGTKPNAGEIDAAKERLSHNLAVMNNLCPLFRTDSFPHEAYYTFAVS